RCGGVEGSESWEIVLRTDIGKVEYAMLADPAKVRLINTDFHAANGYRYRTNMSPHDHGVLLNKTQHHITDPTNPCRAFDDRIEHRLHVRRRAADDAEHLCRCRLMLQGLA